MQAAHQDHISVIFGGGARRSLHVMPLSRVGSSALPFDTWHCRLGTIVSSQLTDLARGELDIAHDPTVATDAVPKCALCIVSSCAFLCSPARINERRACDRGGTTECDDRLRWGPVLWPGRGREGQIGGSAERDSWTGWWSQHAPNADGWRRTVAALQCPLRFVVRGHVANSHDRTCLARCSGSGSCHTGPSLLSLRQHSARFPIHVAAEARCATVPNNGCCRPVAVHCHSFLPLGQIVHTTRSTDPEGCLRFFLNK